MTVLYLVLFLIASGALVLFACWAVMIRMPRKSHRGPPPPLNTEEQEAAARLEHDVRVLALDIGERNVQRRYLQLSEAAGFIEKSLEDMGYDVKRQVFDGGGREVRNIWAEIEGRSCGDEIIIVGSHYDTVPKSPGANDNASAVAANLELARAFIEKTLERTLRFVFFPNEEEPYFMTKAMGSLQYARLCRSRNEKVKGMFSLETMGCYLDGPGTQRYPPPLGRLYPDCGSFVTFVGNLRSRAWVHAVIDSFRRHVPFPSEGIAASEMIRDIRRSDHYPFWRQGYPALMVTDTANFRYDHYHLPTDTPEKLNYEALSRVVCGLKCVLRDLVQRRDSIPANKP